MQITELLTKLKTNYLDSRGVGIRRFAEMCNIKRSRLRLLMLGNTIPTEAEILNITKAINSVELEHTKRTAQKQK